MAMGRIFGLFLPSLSTTFVLLFPLTFSASDSDALLKLKKSLNNAGALDSWVPGSAPCNGPKGPWRGLVCQGGVVTGLSLDGMGLSGTIDVEALVQIQGLRTFSVENNSFANTIPGFNRLGALKVLSLSRNWFSGEIPSDYFAKMGSLKKVRLSYNKFTGKIPDSLAHLSNIVGLHLQRNQFSGRIPSFDCPNLNSLNVSNNRLEGEIPSSLSKFPASSFAGNPGLCGKQVGVQCSSTLNKTSTNIISAMVALGVIILLSVIVFFAIRWRKKKQTVSDVPASGSSNDAVEVPVSMLPKEEGSIKSAGLDSNVSSPGKASVAELVMVDDEKGVFGMPDLMKGSAEALGNGPLGSSYYVRMANGVEVVAKSIKQMNALGRDAFDAEVKKLGKLQHPNVLTPFAYHYRKEEKLFVYEYLPRGSLLHYLHGDGGKYGCDLELLTRVKIVRGIADGLEYLHNEFASRDVPHGNLKLSNVLLGPDNRPLLSDYGYHPLLNVDSLDRLFAYKTPEAIQKQAVSFKTDVYCLGIIILEMITTEHPSQHVNDGNGGSDIVQWVASAFSEGIQTELLDTNIKGCRNSVRCMEKLLHVGALCTKTSPEERLDIKEAIRLIDEIMIELKQYGII
ncbi:Jasmonate-zim-domain protein 6, putative isoform 1 [Hibiscus syriacus]|uniref:Jasmonate-zim-domain protein 6, putative isoform 1 n=1 Tax=Hibiscus syriacus TaxID=106335 RepID=A0A6A2WK40_HIBSY|nr:pollen receptor-like kinase 3 [Hibiscus syriacus]KAE8659578.1 Jasmonate-zim-domain protein 6, putative isoform 1 [Hibiscus syriacus]